LCEKKTTKQKKIALVCDTNPEVGGAGVSPRKGWACAEFFWGWSIFTPGLLFDRCRVRCSALSCDEPSRLSRGTVADTAMDRLKKCREYCEMSLSFSSACEYCRHLANFLSFSFGFALFSRLSFSSRSQAGSSPRSPLAIFQS